MFIEHDANVETAKLIVIYNDEIHTFENEMEANDFYMNKKAESDGCDLLRIFQDFEAWGGDRSGGVRGSSSGVRRKSCWTGEGSSRTAGYNINCHKHWNKWCW